MTTRKKKYSCVCAIHEVAPERPHHYFCWAETGEDALFSPCPVCGSEAIVAVQCRPDGQGIYDSRSLKPTWRRRLGL